MARAHDSSQPYVHQPLKNIDSLRLLKLRHADNPNDRIVCDLFEVAPDQRDTYKYEALSWTWASEGSAKTIAIDRGDIAYALDIRNNLYQALQVLRRKHESRILWIDAICVNQDDPDEKNHQIPMMPSIYGNALRVCIWLGPASEDSNMAIDFIEEIMNDIWKFDELCKPEGNTGPRWHALFSLIMRPWFSRRWIVQEIALANDGLVYCGHKTISWRKFSDAVSLFVEAERATHRLSEIMLKEKITNYIPDLFDNIADLSATLLIDTSNFLFRRLPDGKKDHLLSLEYLVSRLSIFNTTEPSDAVYSLLAIAKDTIPIAATKIQESTLAQQKAKTLGRDLSSRPFYVSYGQDYFDTCKDFVQFSIRQSQATRALDILCRPWAPPSKIDEKHVQPQKMPSWIRSIEDAAFMVQQATLGERINRVNANPLVGLPFGQRSYSAAGTKKLELKGLKFLKREKHFSMFVKGFVLHKVGEVQEFAQFGNLSRKWLSAGGWTDLTQDPPEDLWRTLVANRGPDGRNPLTFYPTALRESLSKGWKGKILDTHHLIHHGRCSTVAQFLRRVQEVIWNRRLMHTYEEDGKPVRLGLVHQSAQEKDIICILYGCTVPIVLRQVEKTPEQILREEELIKIDAAVKIQRQFRTSKQRRLEKKQERVAKRGRHKQRWSIYFEIFSDFADQMPKTMRRWMTRWFAEYQIIAISGLPLIAGVCIALEGYMSLRNLFLASFFGLVFLFLIFPRKLVRRLWTWLVIFWLRHSPKKNKPREELVSRCYYRFIGECYLHGMMDGEAISYQNEKDIKAETFELR